MNYLAHLFLSGIDEHIMVGNFIGDHVKGTDWEKYPGKIKEGILMHRQIDSFTDSHPKFREAKIPFRDEFGLYSGIIVDFVYDHFLARNWDEYSDYSLQTFARFSHAVLMNNFIHLPLRVQGFLPILIKNQRLESYATINGITEALQIMSNYSTLPAKSDFVFYTLENNYHFFEENFRIFMYDLIYFITQNYGIEIRNPFLESKFQV